MAKPPQSRTVPEKYQGVYKRAMAGKSRKAAIRAFCLECVGWRPSEVHLCTAPACPLYPYRPYKAQPKAGAAKRTADLALVG